jgi:hypothetical protein
MIADQTGDRRREIRVEVKGHAGAVVRTRKGCFARKNAGG